LFIVCGGITSGTHGTRYGPHHQGRTNPRHRDLRRTTLLGLYRKAPRRSGRIL
jgi:hypothetical protein